MRVFPLHDCVRLSYVTVGSSVVCFMCRLLLDTCSFPGLVFAPNTRVNVIYPQSLFIWIFQTCIYCSVQEPVTSKHRLDNPMYSRNSQSDDETRSCTLMGLVSLREAFCLWACGLPCECPSCVLIRSFFSDFRLNRIDIVWDLCEVLHATSQA